MHVVALALYYSLTDDPTPVFLRHTRRTKGRPGESFIGRARASGPSTDRRGHRTVTRPKRARSVEGTAHEQPARTPRPTRILRIIPSRNQRNTTRRGRGTLTTTGFELCPNPLDDTRTPRTGQPKRSRTEIRRSTARGGKGRARSASERSGRATRRSGRRRARSGARSEDTEELAHNAASVSTLIQNGVVGHFDSRRAPEPEPRHSGAFSGAGQPTADRIESTEERGGAGRTDRNSRRRLNGSESLDHCNGTTPPASSAYDQTTRALITATAHLNEIADRLERKAAIISAEIAFDRETDRRVH